jgi:predicted unusual protein kinase regulating ubiquinone biosynthesis (AarF/ABC1/UbiB family)
MLATAPRLIGGLTLLAWLLPAYVLVLKVPMPARLRRALRGAVDRAGAAVLAAHMRRNGGLLIKLGQYLASRPDLVPAPYAAACAGLRDQAPARPWAVVAPVLDAAWGGRADRPQIEPEAIAAASFGQVHRGRLADGSMVAVKVQYPGLARAVAADLWVLRLAMRLLGLLLPGWPLQRMADEVADIARREMDYRLEAEAAERLRGPMAACGLRVPQVHAAWTANRVLCMAFAPGASLARTDLATVPAAERDRLARLLVRAFLDQMLDVGMFHGDPHAGNLIYDAASGDLWLIDFGMVGTISPSEAAAYRRFLVALARQDPDGLVDAVVSLGFVLPEADLPELRRLAGEALRAIGDRPPAEVLDSAAGQAVAAQMDRFLRGLRGVVLPRNTVLLSRATGLLEGVCLTLTPDRNLIALARPHLGRLLAQQPLDELRWQVRRLVGRVRTWLGLDPPPPRPASSPPPTAGPWLLLTGGALVAVAAAVPWGPGAWIAAAAGGLLLIKAAFPR